MLRGPTRRGETNPLYLLAGGSLALLIVLIFLLPGEPAPADVDMAATEPLRSGSLFLYCAAAMRKPIEATVAQYATEYGTQVQIQYGGSNTLLNQLEVSQTGDLFLSADERYLNLARERGIVESHVPLAQMHAVIGVPRGNPDNIHSLADLLADRARVSLANPDHAAIGSVTRDALRQSGNWQPLADHVRRHGVFKPTVGDVASDIALGSVDAGIVWDAVAAQYGEIDIVRIPELTDAVAHIGVGVLKSSNDRKSAEHFVRYLSARDRGLEHFEQAGFPVVTGPTWDAVSDNKYNHEGTDDTEGSGHEKHKKAQKEE